MTTITEKIFGYTTNHTPITAYVLKNSNNMEVTILNYGGIIQSIKIPTQKKVVDVVLGFKDMAGYEADTCYIGATIGRVANRIFEGKFTLNNINYTLAKNNGSNHLHGGTKGFSHQIWQGEITSEHKVKLSYLSPDQEEGYPGELNVNVTFSLTEENELCIDYLATSNQDTLINLTNHSYFNLDGTGTIENHNLTLYADTLTESDSHGIPTGKITNVSNTPFDFRQEKKIGKDLHQPDPQLLDKAGYDHNYILAYNGDINLIAIAKSSDNSLQMKAFTNQRGVQLYTGNFLTGLGKTNAPYTKYSGFCLEAQNFPNAINIPSFDSGILKKGETYHQTTIYQFKDIDKE